MDVQAHWDGVHSDRAEDEVSWWQREPTRSLGFVDAVRPPEGGSIVDVGSGAAGLVGHVLDRGFARVVALDVSGEALRRARERLGLDRARLVEWVVADVTQYESKAPLDIWHDRAVFHFLVDDGARRAYVASLARNLNSGGHAVIATFAPDGPERCSGLVVARYDADGLRRVIGSGFELVDDAREEHVTPWGVVQPFTWAVFRRH